MSRRPEIKAPPQVFYNDSSAIKYANNSRMIHIQRQMADRAIELLSLKPNEPAYILDLGCGSGLSGEALSDAGYVWVGCDISHSMLSVAAERDVEGDLFQSDLGAGLYFKEGVFDAAISISTLQWLTNCDVSNANPKKRLANLFNSLFKCLKRGARAIFQLYPNDSKQLQLISECAMKAGFVFSIVIDYPKSSKAKKYYIILDAGSTKRPMPKALSMADNPNLLSNNNNNNNNNTNNNNNDDDASMFDEKELMSLGQNITDKNVTNSANSANSANNGNDDNSQIKVQSEITTMEQQAINSHFIHAGKKKNKSGKKKRGKERFTDRDWITAQKERRRARGKQVPNDSKFSGRKRKPKF